VKKHFSFYIVVCLHTHREVRQCVP